MDDGLLGSRNISEEEHITVMHTHLLYSGAVVYVNFYVIF